MLFFPALIVLAAWYVSTFWYQLMLIQGGSMEPTYHNMQLVLLDKHSKEYSKGDVAAIDCPGLSATIVKRIVAVPGDSVQIENGSLLVNGGISSYYADQTFDYVGMLAEKIVLSEEEYVVIGDNVLQSKDSRYEEVGIVRENQLTGRIIE